MTRWLRAVQRGVRPLTEPTKLTELTEPELVETDAQVLSVKSVLSEGGLLPEGTNPSADGIYAWEERAAIREYDGGQSRDDAEWGATLDRRLKNADH